VGQVQRISSASGRFHYICGFFKVPFQNPPRILRGLIDKPPQSLRTSLHFAGWNQHPQINSGPVQAAELWDIMGFLCETLLSN